jgi:GTPase-activating protein SAC7
MDFWTEALGRLPTANRNLVKHLLNLWAGLVVVPVPRPEDVSASRGPGSRGTGGPKSRDGSKEKKTAERSRGEGQTPTGVVEVVDETECRRLASSVARALFHSGGVKDKDKDKDSNVQPTLALAYLIKMRAEYTQSLGRVERSKRSSNMFLPSTREMMEWRGS